MELVAFVGSDHENVSQVAGLVKKGEWEKVILVGVKPLSLGQPLDFISVNSGDRLVEMRDDIKRKLKGKIMGTEVALSIASGTGKEHMALISALLSVPVGIRFTALTREGIVEL